MQIEVGHTPEEAAARAAELVFEAAQTVLGQKEEFHVALSGGSTAPMMLQALVKLPMPWQRMHFFQVDERIAPAGDEARNLTALLRALGDQAPLPMGHLHPMPVEVDPPSEAAADYQHHLLEKVGRPPAFDLVHLGLGADGHIASLLPDDPVLEVSERDVAVSGPYQGHRRLTLTYPALDRAKRLLFLVTGGGKKQTMTRLVMGDSALPAARLTLDKAIFVLDEAAAPDEVLAQLQQGDG